MQPKDRETWSSLALEEKASSGGEQDNVLVLPGYGSDKLQFNLLRACIWHPGGE